MLLVARYEQEKRVISDHVYVNMSAAFIRLLLTIYMC
jgi:hypothetical protein